jgi:hypothetical protein
MKRLFVFFFAVLLSGAAWADLEIVVQRAESSINAGFRERVFIDGRHRLTLTNGQKGTVRVPNGRHTIHAELYTLTTQKLEFNAGDTTVNFTITPYSMSNFVIESAGASFEAGNVEGSLQRAAAKVMERIPSRSRIAIVYITSNDPDITEYIANELEFIMVENDLTLVDRSQLDRIRREQNFQANGEVDDRTAVSAGKLAGASVIITGAITGRDDLRRLRLRALDVQTGQVLSVSSERY